MKNFLFPYTLFYLFKEILPSFIIGLIALPLVLLTIDSSNLIEVFIAYDIPLSMALKIFMYIILKFLPYTIFTNILIAPLVAYSRLSLNNEIFAFQSLGVPKWILALPYFILAMASSFFVFFSLFYWSPNGINYYNKVIDTFEEQAIVVKMEEGKFIDSFSNTMIFIKKINKRNNKLKDIFIYDKRDPSYPVTILAKEGRFFIKRDEKGSKILLTLENGKAYSGFYMNNRMKFNAYEFYLFTPSLNKKSSSSLEALNHQNIRSRLKQKNISHKEKYMTKMELYKRWNFTFIPLILFLFAFSIILQFGPRSRYKDSMGLSLVVIGVYWILQLVVEALVRSQTSFSSLLYLLCLPNIFFLVLSLFLYKKSFK